jgi:arsenate reductase
MLPITSLHLLPFILLTTPANQPMERTLRPELQRYVNERVMPAVANIPAERKESLDLIAAFVKERKAAGATADLTFICTHNSRPLRHGASHRTTCAPTAAVRRPRPSTRAPSQLSNAQASAS